jgi:hypothetical protein
LRVRLATALTLAVAAAALTSPYSAAAGTTANQQADELVLTMAATGNGATVVKGTLQGQASITYNVRLSSTLSCPETVLEPLGPPFDVATDATGHASFTAAVDLEVPAGDEAVVATATPTTSGQVLSGCQPLMRDSAPPTVVIGDLPTFQTETSFPVTWQGSDQTEVRFHVVFREAAINGDFGSEQGFMLNSTATSETFSGKPGRSYCFRALANDLLGNTSSTGEECTAVLVDNSSMKHRKGFKQRSGGDHFMGTFSWAKRKGATLQLAGIQADQVALLIDRCKRCGKVMVTFPGMKRRVSLKGPKQTQVLVFVGDLASRTPGTLRIKSLTDRPVRVDGVGISAV